jgi:hypothetical protein
MPGFAPVPGTPLAEQDPRGRFDVMAAVLVGLVVFAGATGK